MNYRLITYACLASVCAAVLAQHSPPSTSLSSAHHGITGVWQTGNHKKMTFLAAGVGRNYDGSKFKWRIDGSYLVSERVSADTDPWGKSSRIPIVFTRDGKEFSLVYEAGGLRAHFLRLTPSGKVDAHRTKRDGTYPPDPFGPPARDDDAPPLPAITPIAVGQKHTSGGKNVTASIVVGPNYQISPATERIGHNEVTVATHPSDSRQLLAASMVMTSHPEVAKISVYRSINGGKTWSVTLVRKGSETEGYADPTFAWLPDGTAYFGDMKFRSELELQGAAVQLVKSTDGGETWTGAGTYVGFHDRPFLAVGPALSNHENRVYCSIGFPDRALFVLSGLAKQMVRLAHFDPDSGDRMLCGTPVIDSNGTITMLFIRLETGKVSVCIARSEDHGASFLSPQIISQSTSEGVVLSGLPMMAITPGSSKYKDRLYAVWLAAYLGAGATMCSTSKDGGETWSLPVCLSEQRKGMFAPSLLPTVAVNNDGVAAVCWYDTRDIPLDQVGWNLRFRASLDGGETWLPSVRVSSKTTLNLKPRRKRVHPETRFNNITGGDTAGLAADAAGAFHAVWIDNRTGTRQVFTAKISVDLDKDRGGAFIRR